MCVIWCMKGDPLPHAAARLLMRGHCRASHQTRIMWSPPVMLNVPNGSKYEGAPLATGRIRLVRDRPLLRVQHGDPARG